MHIGGQRSRARDRVPKDLQRYAQIAIETRETRFQQKLKSRTVMFASAVFNEYLMSNTIQFIDIKEDVGGRSVILFF